jgi:hypothetical protein
MQKSAHLHPQPPLPLRDELVHVPALHRPRHLHGAGATPLSARNSKRHSGDLPAVAWTSAGISQLHSQRAAERPCCSPLQTPSNARAKAVTYWRTDHRFVCALTEAGLSKRFRQPQHPFLPNGTTGGPDAILKPLEHPHALLAFAAARYSLQHLLELLELHGPSECHRQPDGQSLSLEADSTQCRHTTERTLRQKSTPARRLAYPETETGCFPTPATSPDRGKRRCRVQRGYLPASIAHWRAVHMAIPLCSS